MKNIKWLSISAFGIFLLIFGSTVGTIVFSMIWYPNIIVCVPPETLEECLPQSVIPSFSLIFQVTSYFVLGGAGIIGIGLIFIMLNHNRTGNIIMLIGLGIDLVAVFFYFFGAIEGAVVYTEPSGKGLALLILLTINFPFELIGVILNFISRKKLSEQRIYQ